jgi:chromosome segregation ATPase
MLKLSVFATLATASPGSSVRKVIELVQGLKAQVEKDQATEADQMKEFNQYCDDNQSATKYAIETAASDIERYQAVIEDQNGIISASNARLEALGQENAAKSSELDSATNVRNSEHKDFKAAEKELVEAVDTLDRAIIIIRRSLSFVQGGGKSNVNVRQLLEKLSVPMAAIIDAAWIDPKSKDVLTDLMQQPQASVSNYDNHSGGIIETLEEMKDKAEASLSSLRRDETKARHAFEMLSQSLQDALKVNARETSEQQQRQAAAGQELGHAKADLAATQASKKADEQSLANLIAECDNRNAEWDHRQADARKELQALAQAIEILSGKFAAFVQTTTAVTKSHEMGSAKRDQVAAMLKKMYRNYHQYGLMQIANSATSDPFGKVRGLINDMLTKLEQESAADADQNAFCVKETKESEASRDKKNSDADKFRARIDKAKAAIANLGEEVSTLDSELAAIDKAVAEATKLRGEQRAEHDKVTTDYKESIDSLVAAIQTLKDYYQGEAKAAGDGGAKFDSANPIIAILEQAESDFTKLLAEANSDEAEAIDAFKKMSQDNKVSKAAKRASKEGKISERKQLGVALGDYNNDLDTTNTELDAVMAYLAKLRDQCVAKAMNYEERKARRDAEIAGLKEALEILSADDGAALIQRNSVFLARK